MKESLLTAIEFTWRNDIRHTEIRTAEPLVPKPSFFKVEIAIEKLIRFQSPGNLQISQN
jgi:hypothetical protein